MPKSFLHFLLHSYIILYLRMVSCPYSAQLQQDTSWWYPRAFLFRVSTTVTRLPQQSDISSCSFHAPSLKAGLRRWSRKESEFFGWSRSRISKNTKSLSWIFLSDSGHRTAKLQIFLW